MATQNGKYETATGDLLAAGVGVDFTNDGSFNASTETVRTDVPIPAKVRGDRKYAKMHNWNGSAWIEKTQPTLIPIEVGAIAGLQLQFNTVAKVDILKGQSVDSTDDLRMFSNATITVDIGVSGANGLDTGSEASDTWYAVHLIADKFGTSPVAGLFSLSATAPTLPTGYNIFRRVGWVRNNASSDFLDITARNNSKTRQFFYDRNKNDSRVLQNGSASTFTIVGLGSYVPPTSTHVHLLVGFETGSGGAAANNLSLRPADFAIANPLWHVAPGIVSANKMFILFSMPCDSSQDIEYKVSNSTHNTTTIHVVGYDDEL